MEEQFQAIAAVVALFIDVAVVAIVAIASVRAFIACVPLLFSGDLLKATRRDIWVRYATALVLALEFSLAADIIRAGIAPSWEALGMLAAIAAIRTFLNFFLARDLETLTKLRREEAGPDG